MDNQKEIWKSHPDISGIEVSTFGKVRTLDKVTSSEKRTRFTKGRILKQHDNTRGYLQVHFSMNGKPITKKVHRLVAETFLSNQENLPQVNHKDCDRTNNNVSNLEWCTSSYNAKYRESFGKGSSKHVFAINLTTLEVLCFQAIREASRMLGVFNQNINMVVNGRRKTAGGYWFVTADDNAVDITKRKLREIGKTKLTAADEASADFVRQALAG